MNLLLTGVAWAFACWVAYDCGFDKGWWEGRYPPNTPGTPARTDGA